VTVLSAVPNRSKASNAKDQNDDAEAFLPVPHLVDKELARPLRQRTLQTTWNWPQRQTTGLTTITNNETNIKKLKAIMS
jgi:hypothetical protein